MSWTRVSGKHAEQWKSYSDAPEEFDENIYQFLSQVPDNYVFVDDNSEGSNISELLRNLSEQGKMKKQVLEPIDADTGAYIYEYKGQKIYCFGTDFEGGGWNVYASPEISRELLGMIEGE